MERNMLLKYSGNYNLKKIITIILLISFLGSCATRSQIYSIGENRYTVDCGGMLYGWDLCYNSANEYCGSSGITQIDKRQVDHPPQWNDFTQSYLYPVDRTLIFACR